MRDERLLWVLTHERLERRAKRLGVWGWVSMICTLGLGIHVAKRVWRNRMALYSLAVERAAAKLTTDERRALRADRVVPAWFMAEVDRQFVEAKHE
jgi:hypothetical protein